MKITQIKICNYRAFFNAENESEHYVIDLPNGANLLIYGENGSGKSSFYKATEDFFKSHKEQIEIEPNIFTASRPDLPETSIKMTIDGTEYEFNRLASGIFNKREFDGSSVIFLSYRDILKTYLIDKDKERPNLYPLFVNNLLGHLTGSVGHTDINNRLDELYRSVKTFEQSYKEGIRRISDTDTRKEILDNLKESLQQKIDDLNVILRDILVPAIEKVNLYLTRYFESSIKVKTERRRKLIAVKYNRLTPILSEELFLDVYLSGTKIVSKGYQAFLNEARLSALAISIYLAAMKIESSRIIDPKVKLLILDDILIGLDTNNRTPLLRILAEEFAAFQIIITTYDRHWFEVSKRWLSCSAIRFIPIELYPAEFVEGNLRFERPLLLSPSLSYYQKASKYFEKKDYPAAANYLRKAFEEKLKQILPIHYKLAEEPQTGVVRKVEMLRELFFRFKDYAAKNNIDTTGFEQFENYSKIIYNSLSHDDLESPHYAREISDSISLIKKLYEIESKIILKAGQQLDVVLWSKGDPSKTLHEYKLTILENLTLIRQGKNEFISNSNCELIAPDGSVLSKSFNKTIEHILISEGYGYPGDCQELYKNISVNSRKKLSTLLRF